MSCVTRELYHDVAENATAANSSELVEGLRRGGRLRLPWWRILRYRSKRIFSRRHREPRLKAGFAPIYPPIKKRPQGVLFYWWAIREYRGFAAAFALVAQSASELRTETTFTVNKVFFFLMFAVNWLYIGGLLTLIAHQTKIPRKGGIFVWWAIQDSNL